MKLFESIRDEIDAARDAERDFKFPQTQRNKRRRFWRWLRK